KSQLNNGFDGEIGYSSGRSSQPTQAESEYLKIDPTLLERTGLTVEQLQELVEIFQLVDVDHGGTISTDELETLMKTLGLRATQTELDAMVKELDEAGTGEIDFESFVKGMTRKVETDLTEDDLLKAFKTFCIYDKDNNVVDQPHEGSLPTETVVEILTMWGDIEKRLIGSE
ncbi:hypothetical protein HDU76_012288, partial [Blyttiomyces sp. JEL0837]